MPKESNQSKSQDSQTEELSAWLGGSPQLVGWYLTRSVADPEVLQPQRRWWPGPDVGKWSVFVLPGEDDAETERCRATAVASPDRIEYRGLVNPPVGGYAYDPDPQSRTNKARALFTPSEVDDDERLELAEDPDFIRKRA